MANYRLSYVEGGEPKTMLTGTRQSTRRDLFVFGLHHGDASGLRVEQETADGWTPVEPAEDVDEAVWRHADVEAWLKAHREAYRSNPSDGSDGRTGAWWAIDGVLDDLRDHFCTGMPLHRDVQR